MNNNEIEKLNSIHNNNNNNENKSEKNSKKANFKKKTIKKKTSSSINSTSSNNNKNNNNNLKKKKTKINTNKDLIQNNFVVLTKINQGSFGNIYLSFNLRDNIEVAIKKEIKKSNYYPQLKTEFKIYQSLLQIPLNKNPINYSSYIKKQNSLLNNSNFSITGEYPIIQEKVTGVPIFYGVGELPDSFYLILEFLGPNLTELFTYCNYKKFSIPTICLLAIQMINRIENLHKHNFIHRDIKPENFVIGLENKSNIIYLIDFGLSKRFKNSKTFQHIPYRENRSLIGTVRYSSINSHLGIEPSRRDDLESIAYVLIYFLKGFLPWQGLTNGKDKFFGIMEKKLQIPTEILCFNLPDEIGVFLNYCKSLRFEDQPDYDYMRSLFIELLGNFLNNVGITKDNLKFDWLVEDLRAMWKKYMNYDVNNNNNINNNNNNINNNDNNNNIENNNCIISRNNDSECSSLENKEEDEEEEEDENNLKKNLSEGDVISFKSINSIVSDNTLKYDFNGFEQFENANANNYNNNLFFNFSETIDKYIDNLMNKKIKNNNNSFYRSFTYSDDNKENNLNSNIQKNNISNKNKDSFINFPVLKKENDELILDNNKNNENDNNNNENNNNNNNNNSKDLLNFSFQSDEEKTLNLDKNNNEKEENKHLNINNNNNNNKNEPNFISNVDNEKTIKVTPSFKSKDLIIKTNSLHLKKYAENTSKPKDPIRKTMKINNNIKKKFLPQKSIKTFKKKYNFSSKNLVFNKNNSSSINNKLFFSKSFIETSKIDLLTKKISKNKSNNLRLKKFKNTKLQFIENYKKTQNKIHNSKIDLCLSKNNLIPIKEEPVSKYYTILSSLGKGSYGKVKKVIHKKLNEIRAMKIVSKRSQYNNNEIEILRQISHPNIINIFEIFSDNKKYYIMSEFCEGGELLEMIAKKSSFNEFDAARIIRQILQAVNYLHQNNFVHRDLKPENIMLMSNHIDLKLIDFGTAVELHPGEKLVKFIGTSYYIAPEVISRDYNEKCDVWSCGIILYILLCGYPPFNGQTNKDIYNSIKYSKLLFVKEEWKDVSKNAISLIKQMLDKDPNNRLSAEECLNHKWFKVLEKMDNQAIMNHPNKKDIIQKMTLFVQQNKFKQAVLQFISTQFNLKKEEEHLRKIFKAFDEQDKGVISKEDFKNQIKNIYGDVISDEITNNIYKQLDLDNSGEISYNEFLTSVIDSKKILTEDRLQKAFSMFDKDGNGRLSLEEIKVFFGGNDKTWKKVLKEIDDNGDGEVDFNEFKKMMVGFDPREIVGDNTIGKDESSNHHD